jgi:hypothetical protein
MRIIFGLLAVVSAFGWPLLGSFVRDFATLHPDTLHTFAVHEHGGTFYLGPALGMLYEYLPWILALSVAAALLLNWLSSKRPWRWM